MLLRYRRSPSVLPWSHPKKYGKALQSTVAKPANEPHFKATPFQIRLYLFCFQQRSPWRRCPTWNAASVDCLRRIAESRGGVAKVAKDAGVERESLYRALSAKGYPRLSTLVACEP
jgi:hypothetical protein